MDKYYCFFDYRKYETWAKTPEKAASNLRFQICQDYRHRFTLKDISVEPRKEVYSPKPETKKESKSGLMQAEFSF